MADAAAAVRALAPELSWTATDKLHLTLKFIGDHPDDAVDALIAACREVAARHVSFAAVLSRVGAFPTLIRPRVLWIGVARDPRLELLQHDLEERCATLGIEVEGRPFRPHITLARVSRPLAPERAREVARIASGTQFRDVLPVETVDVMLSEVRAGQTRYRCLAAAPLATTAPAHVRMSS